MSGASEFEPLFQATISRINQRLATDASLKMINARAQDLMKRVHQAETDAQQRAEVIAREEWTAAMKQVRGY